MSVTMVGGERRKNAPGVHNWVALYTLLTFVQQCAKVSAVKFLLKIVGSSVLNGAALYGLAWFFSGFSVTGGWRSFVLGGVVLMLINLILRPILRIVSFPLILLTFGLFNVVIHVIILIVANYFLTELSITGISPLFWGALVIGIINSIL